MLVAISVGRDAGGFYSPNGRAQSLNTTVANSVGIAMDSFLGAMYGINKINYGDLGGAGQFYFGVGEGAYLKASSTANFGYNLLTLNGETWSGVAQGIVNTAGLLSSNPTAISNTFSGVVQTVESTSAYLRSMDSPRTWGNAYGYLAWSGAEVAISQGVTSYASNALSGMRVAAKSSSYVNLASRSRTAHIIAGDATGGGHAWFGSAKSFMNGLTGKRSMFPATWSNSKIMNGVSEVVTSNPWVQQTGRAGAMFTRSGQPVRFVTEGFYNGTKIRVINTHSEIITAFPIR